MKNSRLATEVQDAYNVTGTCVWHHQSKARWNWAKAVASMPIRYSNNKMRALN